MEASYHCVLYIHHQTWTLMARASRIMNLSVQNIQFISHVADIVVHMPFDCCCLSPAADRLGVAADSICCNIIFVMDHFISIIFCEYSFLGAGEKTHMLIRFGHFDKSRICYFEFQSLLELSYGDLREFKETNTMCDRIKICISYTVESFLFLYPTRHESLLTNFHTEVPPYRRLHFYFAHKFGSWIIENEIIM